jgi:catechol 2,3-dioxygenase
MSYQARLGHAKLYVRDLDASVRFYCRFLNLQVTERVGDDYAFLSSGESHHELALERIAHYAAPAALPRLGLAHLAFQVPDSVSFQAALERLTAAGIPLRAVNNQISWSLYFDDPDGNGVELYWDTRREPGGSDWWRGVVNDLTEAEIGQAISRTRIRVTQGSEMAF